jgi:two-component system, OmpR family, KDP operon response regulator KdpE
MPGLTASRVLLVDDEPSIRRALRPVLLELGFEVVEASRGEEAIHLLRAGKYDVMLLDLSMPGIGGMATLSRARILLPRLPVIIVSVRDDEEEKIAALDLGASDYVTKPFSTPELIARIRSVIRRAQAAVSRADGPRIIGEIQVIPSNRKVTKAGQPVHLTRKEFDIVYYLIKGAGRVVTHREILTAVWGEEYREANDCLRTFVRQIRKKIEDDPSNPRYLLTHAYVGYTFNDNPM